MTGMIPEGLILLTSVALAVGVVRLGGKGTLVQELYGIETLARVDTLCLDKTGTLTKGEMAVERLDPVGCTEADMRRELGRFLSAFDDPTPTLEALRRAIPPVEGVVTGTLPFSSARKKSAVAFEDVYKRQRMPLATHTGILSSVPSTSPLDLASLSTQCSSTTRITTHPSLRCHVLAPDIFGAQPLDQ